MSVKLERYNHSFTEEISKILHMEVKDETLRMVSITGCEITNDLSFAKVYYSVLDKQNLDEISKTLNKARSFIRGELSKRVQIRHTPELRFIYDESIDEGMKIEKIIEDLKEDKED